MRSSLIVLNSLIKFSIIHFSLLVVVLFYGYSFCFIDCFDAMCRYLVLCAIVLFYGPSSRSMCHHSVLWTFILFNVPLFCSMALYLYLCAVVLFYGPSSCSMCHHSVLWPFISFYVPSSCSIARHLNQCNFYTQLWIFIHPNA